MIHLPRSSAARKGVPALALLLVAQPVAPAIITVEGDCLLADAIRAANDDAPAGGCPAGSGPDTLVLTDDVVLNAVEEVFVGNNGLPTVTSEITIDGRNHTIERNPSALSDFRIASVQNGDLTLDRVAVSGGREEAGGAFFMFSGALTLRNSTISSNRAVLQGGAISSYGDVFVHRTTFASNLALGDSGIARGGAIYNVGNLTVDESTFDSNVAGSSPFFGGSARGGAIHNLAVATISGSTFRANEIPYGASREGTAIYAEYNPAAESLDLTNTTLSFNGCGFDLATAGAISNRGQTVTLTNVTLSGNGDVALSNYSGTMVAKSTIIANTSQGPNCSGTITDGLNNIADDDSCGTIPSGLTGLDPNLEDHGGPTETHALLEGSNAIDAAGACGVPADQRGAPRVGPCDIGAYEYLGCPVLTLADDTIATTETYEECAIAVGPNLAVVGPGGDLTLRTGTTASFGDGFSVGAGAALTVDHDPSLELLLPELIEADRARRRALADPPTAELEGPGAKGLR